MRYIWQHIQQIIENYNGSLPLAHFLKNYFKQHPKLGSRDRKLLANLAYSWYRCEKGLRSSLSFQQKLKSSLELCGIEPNPLLFEGVETAPPAFDPDRLAPRGVQLTEGITRQEWLASMRSQPSLFIRIRKDKDKIINALKAQNIPYHFLKPDCLVLQIGAKIDGLFPEDAYVVQDASSQETGTFFHPERNERWYDCCAGAGGKSLLLKDKNATVQLTVSDVRESILHNLHDRFRLYHHTQPVGKITDVADENKLSQTFGSQLFDKIICDAPCSGSGTWSRTPEQLYFFKPESLKSYSERQVKIATNVAKYLKPGGSLIYITCSIFSIENEMVAEEVMKLTGLTLKESKLINGTANKADNMFVAVLTK